MSNSGNGILRCKSTVRLTHEYAHSHQPNQPNSQPTDQPTSKRGAATPRTCNPLTVLVLMLLIALEFVDTTSVTTVANHEHFQCTDIDWSPCGRYCITSSTQPLESSGNVKQTLENGYKLWSMQGRLLNHKPVETLYQAMWRPRPPSTLPLPQREEKYLREKYWDKFTKSDEKIRQSHLSGVAAERQKLKEEWKAIRHEHLKDYEADAPTRAELRGGLYSDEEEDFETIETVVEEEVSRIEEVVSNKEWTAGTKAKAAETKAAQAAYAAANGGAAAAASRDSKDEDD